MLEQIGRVSAPNRPGLCTWFVSSLSALDNIASLGDAADTPITSEDVGRVARVGSKAPFRYFELSGVSPNSWAEIGSAPVSSGSGGSAAQPAGVRDMSASFFLPMVGPSNDGLDGLGTLAAYSIGAIPGAFIVEPEKCSISLMAKPGSETSDDAITVLVGLNRIGYNTSKFTPGDNPPAFRSKRFAICSGAVARLIPNLSNGQSYTGVSLSLGGIYDPEAPPLNGDPQAYLSDSYDTGTIPKDVLVMRPVVAPDASGIGGVALPFSPFGIPQAGFTAYVFSAVKDNAGSYMPGKMLGRSDVDSSGGWAVKLNSTVDTSDARYFYIGIVADQDVEGAIKMGDSSPSLARNSDGSMPGLYTEHGDAGQAYFDLTAISADEAAVDSGGLFGTN